MMGTSVTPSAAAMSTIRDVRCLEAKHAPGAQVELFVYQAGAPVPFAIQRVFTVHAKESVHRGHHAHKACSQAMVCLVGACDVTVDDGLQRRTWQLERPSSVLVIPPSLWAEQNYRGPGTILMVLCDRAYEESDYIRDYDAFLAYRSGAA